MAALLLEMIEERGGEDWSQVKERQVRGSKERLDDTDIQCMKRWGLANTFRWEELKRMSGSQEMLRKHKTGVVQSVR